MVGHLRRWMSITLFYNKLNEEVYMYQPVGFVNKEHPNHVYKWNKAIYVLKQAPKVWYKELSQFLVNFEFVSAITYTSLFIYSSGKNVIYFLVYVDDLIITGNNTRLIDEFVVKLSNRFSLKDLGDLTFFLRVEVVRIGAGTFLSKQRYISELLDKFDIINAKPMPTPMATSPNLIMQMQQNIDSL